MSILRIYKAISNPNRIKIYELCDGSNNISEIARKLNLNYKSVFQHLSFLEQANLIKKNKEFHKSGQECNFTIIKQEQQIQNIINNLIEEVKRDELS